MCDGTYAYPTKGGAPVTLDKPLLLICGNAKIEEVYPNAYQYIKARFIQIRVDPAFVAPAADSASNYSNWGGKYFSI